MFRIMLCRICNHGSVVRALRLISERLPVLTQAVCFCPSGLCARILFKSSETKPALTSRRGGLLQRDNSYFQFAACTGTTVYKSPNGHLVDRTSVLLPIFSRFNLAIGWALTCSLYTAPPDIAKCNAFLLTSNAWRIDGGPSGYFFRISLTTFWTVMNSCHDGAEYIPVHTGMYHAIVWYRYKRT